MKLLLIEDEKRMVQALTEILRQENYSVDTCIDGISGLQAIESDIYDVVILDIMLPGMNGYDVAKSARKNGIRTPILMLTAKGNLIYYTMKKDGYTLVAFMDNTILQESITTLVRSNGLPQSPPVQGELPHCGKRGRPGPFTIRAIALLAHTGQVVEYPAIWSCKHAHLAVY